MLQHILRYTVVITYVILTIIISFLTIHYGLLIFRRTIIEGSRLVSAESFLTLWISSLLCFSFRIILKFLQSSTFSHFEVKQFLVIIIHLFTLYISELSLFFAFVIIFPFLSYFCFLILFDFINLIKYKNSRIFIHYIILSILLIIILLLGFALEASVVYATVSIAYISTSSWKLLSNALVRSFIITVTVLILHFLTVLLMFSAIFLVVHTKMKLCKPLSLLLTLLILLLFISPLVLPIIATLLIQPKIEISYREMTSYIKAAYPSRMCNLSYAWKLAENYYKNFTFVRELAIPKPRQLILELPLLGMWNRDVVSKLAALDKIGACEDFALAITVLIRDILRCNVRIVVLVPSNKDSQSICDHSIPEVEVDGKWYVIDISYTAHDGPIEVDKYAERIKSKYPILYEHLSQRTCKLIDYETRQDLTREHGFTP